MPLRDVCLQTPEGVQLFFSYDLFGLVRVYWTLNLQTVFRFFETPPMFYLMGRTDGLDGPEKCPLNFFRLCEHLELIYIYIYIVVY